MPQISEILEKVNQQVKNRFPYGRANHKGTLTTSISQYHRTHNLPKNFDAAKKIAEIEFNANISAYSDYQEHRNYEDFSKEPLKALKSYTCEAVSRYAGVELIRAYPGLLVEIIYIHKAQDQRGHALLVINRPNNSDDIKDWGNQAIIYDPWTSDYFPATEFFTKQNTAKSIFIIDPESIAPKPCSDYLQGTPKVNAEFSQRLYTVCQKSYEQVLKDQGKNALTVPIDFSMRP